MRCARALATWLRRQSISCIVSRNQSIRGIITWRHLSQSQVGASGVGRKDTEEFSPFISGELTMQVVVILLGQGYNRWESLLLCMLDCLSRLSTGLPSPKSLPGELPQQTYGTHHPPDIGFQFLLEQTCNHFKGGVCVVLIICEFLGECSLHISCQPQPGFASQIIFSNSQISCSRPKGKEPHCRGAFSKPGNFAPCMAVPG